MAELVGKYKLVSSENFDEFMKATDSEEAYTAADETSKVYYKNRVTTKKSHLLNRIFHYKNLLSKQFREFIPILSGVGIMMRKLGGTSKPIVDIIKDGDTWTVKTVTTFKTTEITFKLGEEFQETRMDGSVVKTVITLEEDKLVQKQFGDKEVVITREIEDGKLKVVCTVGDIVSTRIYDKLE